jgi:hypothetical protein
MPTLDSQVIHIIPYFSKNLKIKYIEKLTLTYFLLFTETVLYRDTEVAPCAEGTANIPFIELIAILDGSWTKWEGQRIIRYDA